MANYSEEEEEDQFFDTRDEITSVSDLGSDCSDEFCSCSRIPGYAVNSLGHELWMKTPDSAHLRRSRFLEWMGLNLDQKPIDEENSQGILRDEHKIGIGRIYEDNGAVLRDSDSEDFCLSAESSSSGRSAEEAKLSGEDAPEEKSSCKIKNLDDGTEFVFDGINNNGMLSRVREVGSNRLITIEEFQRTFGSSSLVQQLLRREVEIDKVMNNNVKIGWLRKLSVKARKKSKQRDTNLKSSSFNPEVGAKFERVQVHSSRKRLKELSSLYVGQEFPAHEGPILTMKFSPDGHYLATAGEDGVVRIWKVIEDEEGGKLDMQYTDPSCLYFSVNHLSKLAPVDVTNDKINKMKRLKKSSESACVILPPKVFRILEEPLHEFRGHNGQVLALSWSKNGCLLSSSVDKTVRLWHVGYNQCHRVFSHNNYVTCVEFNPVDENYFISGSIDGKVRIWEVHGGRVVDWIDVKDIVTAVCYYPNGTGAIVGSMDGSCRFYDVIDNMLQPDAQISSQGKKKLPCKRITGFQFSPSDPSKVLVTSADSQVRVLCGIDVIFKIKGPRISGGQVTASFTTDGKHIVFASEDSNVYVWDYVKQERSSPRSKNIHSCESFFSNNTSIAVPWCGMNTFAGSLSSSSSSMEDVLASSILGNGQCDQNLLNRAILSPSDCFPLSSGSLTKGTAATWPEEELPDPSRVAASSAPTMCRSDYKFLRSSCQNTYGSHMWGLVIVTASWDGQIRTFCNYGLPIRAS